jgi:ATP-dependent DNA ligase
MDQAAANASRRRGAGWLHEIKYDGYRMHARIDGGKATLLTLFGSSRP